MHTPLPEIDQHDLPDSLTDVVAAIGLSATLILVERWGGIRIGVMHPDRLTPEHPIAQAIGLPAARKLARIYGTDRPPLPRAVRAVRRARNRQIRMEFRTQTAAQIARRHQLTERQVYTIVGAPDDDDAPSTTQAGLF